MTNIRVALTLNIMGIQYTYNNNSVYLCRLLLVQCFESSFFPTDCYCKIIDRLPVQLLATLLFAHAFIYIYIFTLVPVHIQQNPHSKRALITICAHKAVETIATVVGPLKLTFFRPFIIIHYDIVAGK